MRQSVQLKILSTLTFTMTVAVSYAQSQVSSSIGIDPLIKIVSIIFTIGGLFIGYMQMRTAIKMAELEAKVQDAISKVKEDFASVIDKETEKLETKIQLSGKEIEAKMATRHDIDNLKTVMKLQHDLTNAQMEGLKDQLKNAASNYKRDNG